MTLARVKFFLVILLVLSISLYLFKSVFNYYYFGDDWFNFKITKVDSFGDYLAFFKFREDIPVYRPIALQTFFFFLNTFFGFNAFVVRLINFALLAFSYMLTMNLLTKISGSKQIGFLASSIWVTASIHFMNLAAINYNLIGTFFWLITFLLFIKFCQTQKKIYYFSTFIFFLLSIGSFELALTWIPIAIFYYLFIIENSFSRTVKIFFPYMITATIYLTLRLIYVKFPPIVEYYVAFNLDSVKAFFWYILWAFNVPEEFKKQIIGNLIIFNQVFLKDYWILVIKAFMGAFAIVILGIIYPIYRIYKIKKSANFRLVFFGIFWFCVTIFPVILLPNHNFIMYLTLPAIGLYFLISYLILQSQKAILPFLIFFIWLFVSLTTINFYKVNFFFNEAQRFSRNFSLGVTKQFPILPKNSVILFQLNDSRYKQALFGSNAIKALYADPSLLIYYNKGDLFSDLKKGIKGPVYIYIPE